MAKREWFDRALIPPTNPGQWPAFVRRRWDAFFFEAVPAVRLGVLRIVFVALQVCLFQWPLEWHLAAARHNEGFIDPEPLMRLLTTVVPEEVVRSEWLLTGIHYGSYAFGLLALIGLFSRTTLAIFALCHGFLIVHLYSYGEKHHPEALYLLIMFLMAMAPCGRFLAVDALIARRRGKDPLTPTKDALWPLRLGQVLMSMAYFMAGACKLHMSGGEWLKGPTLQGYLLEDAVRWDRPVGLWLAQQPTLCTMASITSVLFELFFPIILLVPRLAPLFLLSGAMFHIGVYIAQAAPFFQFIALYLMWVPMERWVRSQRAPL